MATTNRPPGDSLTRRIAAQVWAEMKLQGISQEKLATLVGRSQPWISRRLSGSVPINATELEEFAAALDVPTSRLIPLDSTGATR